MPLLVKCRITRLLRVTLRELDFFCVFLMTLLDGQHTRQSSLWLVIQIVVVVVFFTCNSDYEIILAALGFFLTETSDTEKNIYHARQVENASFVGKQNSTSRPPTRKRDG